MAKKKQTDEQPVNSNETMGEVVGYEVKDLPKLVEDEVNEEGEVVGCRTKNARVVGALVVRFDDGEESRILTLHLRGRYFSKCQGEDINYTDSRPVKDEIFRNLLQKIPFGSTVPLKRKPSRGGKQDRPFYTLDMDALKIE
jgi:hypothetical protein